VTAPDPTTLDPISLFLAEQARARRAGEPWEAAAAALATLDEHGAPSVRFVLVKQADSRGLHFFTNRESDKGQHLARDPRASIALHFATTNVQLRFEGRVALLADADSDAYFAGRPRISQLGAWASWQSRPLGARAELEARLHEQERRFEGGPVARPPHWGGYALDVVRAEHWVEGAYRLHDRLRFERDGGGWRRTRLNP
jgi:pyridoxamine 5'-phosphate oxidase